MQQKLVYIYLFLCAQIFWVHTKIVWRLLLPKCFYFIIILSEEILFYIELVHLFSNISLCYILLCIHLFLVRRNFEGGLAKCRVTVSQYLTKEGWRTITKMDGTGGSVFGLFTDANKTFLQVSI